MERSSGGWNLAIIATGVSTAMPSATSNQRPPTVDLLHRLGSSDSEVKLKALREMKNQIIGNRTKKLSYLKLGAVATVANILSSCSSKGSDSNSNSNILVQSAAVIGSFACGFDDGVQAVLDAGAFPNLFRLLSYPNEKVVDASARSLRMIYQSKLAPKYDLFQEKNMDFIMFLLNSENENVGVLGASVITHSCNTSEEQKLLYDAGVLKKLISLLQGSINLRDASLEAMAVIFENNHEVIDRFCEPDKGLSCVIELARDRNPRTRLLSCMCLIVIRNTSPSHLNDVGITKKLVYILLELLDDASQVGDETSFVFSTLISKKEDAQNLALEANAIEKLASQLEQVTIFPKRLQGILLGLAEMCSALESCRSRFESLQVLNLVADALNHDSADVRTAACFCLRSVFRSRKNLSAGHYMTEMIVNPLVQLLQDPSSCVQVAALSAISNLVVDFTTGKSIFIQAGGVSQLVLFSSSMDPALRSNSLRALRNCIFSEDIKFKQKVFKELSASLLATLICDPEPLVQEQAFAFVRNLVDGCMDSIEFVFAEDSVILNAVGKQLQSTLKDEVGIQGMYVLSNVASGSEIHKEAIMHHLLPLAGSYRHNFTIKFLQSNDSRLRTAALWAIMNLTSPSCPGAYGRFVKLRSAGIVSQIKNMGNDSCLDVKLRVRTALGQFMTFGDCSATA
ncbi:hypothetical protein ACFE04_028137 [Oxalis oulophora]